MKHVDLTNIIEKFKDINKYFKISEKYSIYIIDNELNEQIKELINHLNKFSIFYEIQSRK